MIQRGPAFKALKSPAERPDWRARQIGAKNEKKA
jgi:hypothetical protein